MSGSGPFAAPGPEKEGPDCFVAVRSVTGGAQCFSWQASDGERGKKLTDDAIATKLIDRILRMALSGLLAGGI
jgi:hypothetical protein